MLSFQSLRLPCWDIVDGVLSEEPTKMYVLRTLLLLLTKSSYKNTMTAVTRPLNQKIQQWCAGLMELRFEVSNSQRSQLCIHSF